MPHFFLARSLYAALVRVEQEGAKAAEAEAAAGAAGEPKGGYAGRRPARR